MALLSPGTPLAMRQPSVRRGAVLSRLRGSSHASSHPLAGVEAPMGAVSDLRLIEESGRQVRLGWTGVPGATEYKVVVRNSQGESAGRGVGSTWGTLPALRVCGCPAPGRWHREDKARSRQPDRARAG